jgi:YbgC/YbaW family acyl-CoA thioester hydrolase
METCTIFARMAAPSTSHNTKTYRCTIEVRGYELDSFGHVNHAKYVSYLEHARWQMLYKEGITLERFQEWKRWPVISAIEMQYLKPAFMGDQLEVLTQVVEHGKLHFSIEQTISKAGTPIARAKVKAVVVNENGRPSEYPAAVSKLWTVDQSEEGAS